MRRLFTLLVTLFCLTARATTYIAASAGQADRDAAYTLCHYGDTIVLPSTSGNTDLWTYTFVLSNNVTIYGAGGSNGTCIAYGILNGSPLIIGYASVEYTNRLAGFTFVSTNKLSATTAMTVWYPVPSEVGQSVNLRIDDNFFLCDSNLGSSQPITTLTSVGGTATGVKIAHGLQTGWYVSINGATPAAYNGTYQITVIDANTFTYTFAGGTSPATGSPRVVVPGGAPGLAIYKADWMHFRCDHNWFDSPNEFIQDYAYSYNLGGLSPNPGWGIGSWSDVDRWGSLDFAFYEYNMFTNSAMVDSSPAAIDCYEGSRVVIRYNDFDGHNWTGHGTEGQGMGFREAEFYSNSVHYHNISGAVVSDGQIRSGTVIAFGNMYYTYLTHGMVGEAYRASSPGTYVGNGDGSGPFDLNLPGPLLSSIITSGNNVQTLTDSTQNWPINSLIGQSVQDLSQKAQMGTNVWGPDTSGHYHTYYSIITGNTATQITFDPGQNNVGLYTSNGDSYALYQVLHFGTDMGTGQATNILTSTVQGGGPGAPNNGHITPITIGPSNMIDTAWSWGNTNLTGSGSPNVDFSSSWPYQETNGVAYTNADSVPPNLIAKPGYTPYGAHPFNQPFGSTTNLTFSFSPQPAYVGQTIVASGAIQTNGVTDTTSYGGNAILVTNNVNGVSPSLSAGAFSVNLLTPATASGNIPSYWYVSGSSGPYNNFTSSIVTLQVLLNPTTSTLVSSINPSTSGGSVMFTYTILTNSPATAPVDLSSGTATLYDNGNAFATGTPSSGVYTASISTLTVGTHVITATYTGNNKYATNYFAGMNQTVNASGAVATTLTITASPNPSVKPGQVTITSALYTNSPTGLATAATGPIVFECNNVIIGSVTPTAGQASLQVTTLPTVNVTLSAVYAGDSNYGASTSTNFPQVNFNGVIYAPSSMGQGTNVYWIGTTATGLLIANGYKGFENLPLDGSTVANFDANILNLPANSIIYVLPGTYPSMGSEAYTLKSGQQLIGSGIGSTIVQFPATLIDNGVISNSVMFLANMLSSDDTVENMTIDCNYQATVTPVLLDGVELNNSYNNIHNVELTNAASYSSAYQECFGLDIYGQPTGVSNTISGCVLNGFTCSAGNDMSGINMVGCNNSICHDNFIYQLGANLVYGYNMSGVNLTESNDFGSGLAVYGYTDSVPGGTNMTYEDDILTNCEQFLSMQSGTYSGVTIQYCTGIVTRRSPADNATVFILKPTSGMTGLLVSSNSINSTGNTNGVFACQNLTNAVIQANTFFATSPTTLETNFSAYLNIIYTGNSNFVNTAWP